MTHGEGGGAADGAPLFPPAAFGRVDEGQDGDFYAPPRLVTHIDDNAIAALRDFYGRTLPRDGVLLDLMSSWVSHLPQDLTAAEVIGHGMNATELSANPRLTRWFVQDLNRDQALPLADASVDGAMCCVSVQYLQHPVQVFTEVRRALRRQAPFIVSFSNRCFPTKAVAVWRSLNAQGHAALVRLFLERAGFTDITLRTLADGRRGDPLHALVGLA